jgi:uncharacterized membrane protein
MQNKMNTFLNLALAAVILVAVDMLYLSIIGQYARAMFAKIQGSPMRFNYLAAAIVYAALAFLLTRPFIDSWWTAFSIGAATYAVYDFTNLATLKDYSVQFAMIDTLWGGVLFGFAHMLHGLLKGRIEGSA